MKTPLSEFRTFLFRYAVCIGVIVVVGSIYNYEALKYVRSKGTGCSQGILILNKPDSHVCCSSESYWVCYAAFDKLERIMSSQWAFVLPLVPVMFNIFLENWLYCSKANTIKLTGALARLGLYVCIVLFRTVRSRYMIFSEYLPSNCSLFSIWFPPPFSHLLDHRRVNAGVPTSWVKGRKLLCTFYACH